MVRENFKIMELIRTNDEPAYDGIDQYVVKYYTSKTIGEFINEVLRCNRKEWGEISIYYGGLYPICEYKEDLLLSLKKSSEELCSLPIESITAYGGWTNMDYVIRVR